MNPAPLLTIESASRFLRWICFSLLATLALPATSHADILDELITTICAPENIQRSGASVGCKGPMGLPHPLVAQEPSWVCEILMESTLRGRFVRGKDVIIADFGADCLSHAENFGGSALFEIERDGRPKFRGYAVGTRSKSCQLMRLGSGVSTLFCLERDGHWGELEDTLVQLTVSRVADGKLQLARQVHFEAARYENADDTYGIRCDTQFIALSIYDFRLNPARKVVQFTVEYADKTAIARACPTSGPSGDEHEGYLPIKATRSADYELDVRTGRIARARK